MEIIETKVKSGDIDLHVIHPKRIESDVHIIVLHGFADHSGRYVHLMEQFYKQGWNVTSYDHRGHGQSGGERANIKRFGQLTEDLDTIVNHFLPVGKKLYLFAHSMGGLVGIRYLQTFGSKHFAGAMFSGPLIQPDDSVPKILVSLSGIIAKILPSLPTIKLDGNAISRDPLEVQKYNEDPLNYRGGTKARIGAEMVQAMKAAQSQFDKIKLPIIIIYGTADRLANPNGSRLLYAGIQSADKTILPMEGYYHELINENGREAIFKSYVNWLRERV